jgi:bisphosphoglycerate-independent phosphoglycerate mutase (AlkP superfamily)
VADAGIRQLRISETEKYAHVTFFFNAQIEKPFEGEEGFYSSPKVATYDLKPEMSVYEIRTGWLRKSQRESTIDCDQSCQWGHGGPHWRNRCNP